MKRILIYLFATLMTINVAMLNTNKKIMAEEVNSCATFEVDWINDDGSFTWAGCKNTLEEAKVLMSSDPLSKGDDGKYDYVVRHQSSKSASKIVAMQSGVVYSVPERSGTSTTSTSPAITMPIFQYPNRNGVSSDLDPRRPSITTMEEMKYYETLSYNPSTSTGDVKVMCYGFEGYARIDDTDLVPTKYLTKGLKIGFGGNTYYGNSAGGITNDPVYLSLSKNYYTVEKASKGNYLDLVYHYHSYGSKSNGSFGVYSYAVGKAPSFMQENVKYYSSDGINFYTDINESSSFAGTYYNYYQFVPLRATSNVKVEDFDKFLKYKGVSSSSELYGTGQLFLNAEAKYGINAMIMFGIACNEVAYGTKIIYKNIDGETRSTHNLFNTNAVDTNTGLADVFDSVEQCVNQTASFWFASYIDLKDARFYGSHLGNKGAGLNVRYATDPLWGLKAASNAYLLDKIANNFDGKLSNVDKDTLGVITTFNANLYKEADLNSKVYKKAYYGTSYMKDFTVIMQDVTSNGFVKVVSTNPISSDRENMLMWTDIQRDTSYNRDSSYFYVKSSDILQVSNTVVRATGDYTHSISSVTIGSDTITIRGTSYTPGVIIPSSAISTKVETYKGSLFGKAYTATKTINGDVISFEVSIPLSDLSFGTYSFKVSTSYGGYSQYNGTFNLAFNDYIAPKTIGDKVYKFIYSNELTRLEIKGLDSESLQIRGGIDKFEIKDTILSINGIGYFDKVNFDNLDNISYQLIFDDLNSEYTKTYNLTPYEFDISNDAYIYKYIGFEGEADISDIPNGDYKVFINIKNGNKEKQFAVFFENNALISGDTANRKYSIKAQRSKSYRVELTLANEVIDYSSVKVPTDFMSRFIFDSININGNILEISQACSFIRYIDYKQTSDVNFSLMLVNIDTGARYNYNFDNKLCEFDYDSLQVFDNLVNYGCFDGESVDLSNVISGTYAIYVKNTNAPYIDIFNMYSPENINVNSGKYHVYTNDINNVYLTVK